MTLNHVGIFAKFWQPGTVKTRLAATIGAQAACDVYQAFLFHLLHRHQNSGDARTVVFSPPQREAQFREAITNHWDFTPQSDGDLGTRMRTFFEEQFKKLSSADPAHSRQVNKIVVIGADCPQLDCGTIETAFSELDHAPVVIGPSTDGGYYLIAMRDTVADIFSGIQWSTESVFQQTVDQLESAGIGYRALTPLTDIDERENLVALYSQLQQRAASDQLDAQDLELLSHVKTALDVEVTKDSQ